MGSEWRKATLGDLIEISHGFAFKGEYFRDSPPGDILLTPGNFAIGGGFKGDKLKFYDGPIPTDYVLSEGDLLVTMTDLSKAADTLGYPAIVPKPKGHQYLHNQRLGKVYIRETEDLDNGFLYYRLCGKDYRHEVVAGATGTTVKHTSPNRILAFEFFLPPLPEQKAIAHILGSLDDKIDLNRKMNKTLEEMARAIFKSWFVDFDPVRAKAEGRQPEGMDTETAKLFPDSFEESELGMIPKGWRVGKLGDFVEHRIERVTPSNVTESMPYVPIDCISPRNLYLSDFKDGTEAKSSLTRFYAGDILFGAMRPYFHKVCIAPFDGTTRTTAFVLKPKVKADFSFCVLQLHMDETIDYATRHSTGSTIPYAKWADSLERMPVVLPRNETRQAFGRTIQPILKSIPFKLTEDVILRETRDALLPKLLSGQIRIKDAEKYVEDA